MANCDCELSHNGLGMAGRECDCGADDEPKIYDTPDVWFEGEAGTGIRIVSITATPWLSWDETVNLHKWLGELVAVGEAPGQSAGPTAEQKAACRSMGTKQCAAICMSHLPSFAAGECPEAGRVWTSKAVKQERKRRPIGPLGT